MHDGVAIRPGPRKYAGIKFMSKIWESKLRRVNEICVKCRVLYRFGTGRPTPDEVALCHGCQTKGWFI